MREKAAKLRAGFITPVAPSEPPAIQQGKA